MTEISALPLIELVGPSPRTLLRRRLWGHKGLVISVTLLTLIVLVAVLAPALAPHDPYAQDLGRRLIPPVWYQKGTWVHLLGTDNLGRDYLSRVLYGARISLLIGASVMAISGLIGTTLGLAAGYFGGRVDAFVMFTTTVRLAMPLILVALAVVATVGGSLWVVVLVLGLLKWDRFAVVMRAATQQVRGLEYVAAAECVGASTLRIILGEILPNVLPHLIVVATIEAASAILLEAALSFLGLGVQPPHATWGNILTDGKDSLEIAWWMTVYPGLAILITVLSYNLLGEGIRDALDPRLRQTRVGRVLRLGR
jgi:peptide/nickel transport system permease protein